MDELILGEYGLLSLDYFNNIICEMSNFSCYTMIVNSRDETREKFIWVTNIPYCLSAGQTSPIEKKKKNNLFHHNRDYQAGSV